VVFRPYAAPAAVSSARSPTSSRSRAAFIRLCICGSEVAEAIGAATPGWAAIHA